MIKFLTVLGIVVASLIVLFLLFVCVVLFVPVRYKIGGTNITKEYGYVVIALFCSIIRIRVYYREKMGWLSVRLFGIKIIDNKFPEIIEWIENLSKFFEKFKKKDKESADKEVAQTEENAQNADNTEADVNDEGMTVEEVEEYLNAHDELDDMNVVEKNISFLSYIKDTLLHIKEKWYNFKRFVDDKIKTYEKTKRIVKFYYRVLQCPSLKPTLVLLKNSGITILKHVIPRKVRIKLTYGDSDPYVNAKVAGYIFVLQGLFRKQIDYTPVWNESKFLIEGYVSGRIRVIVFLRTGFRIFTNKHLHRMIRLFRKGGKINGGKQ